MRSNQRAIKVRSWRTSRTQKFRKVSQNKKWIYDNFILVVLTRLNMLNTKWNQRIILLYGIDKTTDAFNRSAFKPSLSWHLNLYGFLWRLTHTYYTRSFAFSIKAPDIALLWVHAVTSLFYIGKKGVYNLVFLSTLLHSGIRRSVWCSV